MVTVLFADLVDSTRLVESLDPEAARGRLDQLFRRLAAEVHRFGGTLEKYVGDAILAVFGFPTTHGDDAARAVRAALALRDEARSLDAEANDFSPRLRIGLDTGEVVAAASGTDLRLAGEAVHTAARIQQAAEPDQILVSLRTLRAVRETIDAGPLRSMVARGKQRPVEVAEVHGFAPASAPAGTVVVDREHDLPRLINALQGAIDGRRLVMLVGEAGVGKTTLARAATAPMRPGTRVLWGRCLPEWHRLPLWPVREVLAAAAGVPVTDPPAVLAAAIGRLVAEAWPEPETAANAAAGVCRLIGLGPDHQAGPPNQIHRGTPSEFPGPLQLGARELAATVAAVLGRLAAQAPTLVVLEDIHWASRDLLDVATILVNTGASAGERLGFLGITRRDAPALGERVAPAGMERIDLAGLPETATSELLAITMGEQQTTHRLAWRVFEASRGNPLFVKELAMAIRDTGEPPDRPPSLPIPDSLRALIGARLDRLPAARKQVLCHAAVIGRWFSPAALSSLVAEPRDELELTLGELARTGLIEPLPDHLTGDRDSYAFHHVLFRDVAYSLLPKAARSDLHQRLAIWLAGRPGSGQEPSEVIAPHLVEAVRLAGEIRQPTPADRLLANRAVAACRRAAQRLREQEALVAAAAMLDDALAIAEVAGTPPEDVAELRVMRGTLRGVTGDPEGAVADLEAATGSKRVSIRAHAHLELSNLQGTLSDYGRAASLAERALAEARSARSPNLLARALRAKALEPFVAGNLVATASLLEEALALCGGDEQSGLAIDLRSTLLPVLLYLATPLDELSAQARELATTARAHGRRNAEAGANWVLGEVHALQGDLDAAERHFTVADQQRRDIGLTSARVWSLLGLARVAVARGDAARARRLAEEAIAVTSRRDGVAEPDTFLHLADASLLDRDLDGARAALDRARASLQPDDVVTHAELERVQARLATAEGDHDGATRLLRQSLATLDETDYRLEHLRTCVELVPALRRAGCPDEADQLAGEVLERARAIGAHALTLELERTGR